MLVHPDIELARAVIRDRLRRRPGWYRSGRSRRLGRRRTEKAVGPSMPVSIQVRSARESDAGALARLAELDDSSPLTGAQLLVAEVGGVLWAALDVESAESVADPFVPSADAVELLRLRARQVRDARPTAGRPGVARRGRASATVGA